MTRAINAISMLRTQATHKIGNILEKNNSIRFTQNDFPDIYLCCHIDYEQLLWNSKCLL